jgi:K+-transporting ATPase ATPase A chain
VDITRGIELLLPLSAILALFLVSQGCVQTFNGPFSVHLLQPLSDASGNIITQTVQVGPVASQVAIKLLGSNGGGFFNVNSAHPFENPTALSNFIEILAMLLLPTSFCIFYGKMVEEKREGYAIFITMFIIYVSFLALTIWAEIQSTPLFASLNISSIGGNMEGKEVRFGAVFSAMFVTTATGTSTGAVNSMIESFTPLGLLGPLLLMQIGEVAFGGVGCGLHGMITFILIANFIGGLMVGRTPEYLGKKLGPNEMKLVTIIIIIPIVTILIGSAIAVSLSIGQQAISSYSPRGFTEIIYAFTSATQNNGSAMAGINANNPFYNITLAIAMIIGRYLITWFVIGLAGSLVEKKRTPPSAGTLKTYTPLYIGWLIGVIIIVGALSFIPVLVLGPIVEAML